MSVITIASYALVFVLGMLITVLILSYKKDAPDGTFRINTFDPDKDVYSLEFETPLNEVANKKSIVFKVEVESKP